MKRTRVLTVVYITCRPACLRCVLKGTRAKQAECACARSRSEQLWHLGGYVCTYSEAQRRACSLKVELGLSL